MEIEKAAMQKPRRAISYTNRVTTVEVEDEEKRCRHFKI